MATTTTTTGGKTVVALIGSDGHLGQRIARALHPDDVGPTTAAFHTVVPCRRGDCPVHAARNADVVVVATRPNDAPDVFRQLGPHLTLNQTLVSTVAGTTPRIVRQLTGGDFGDDGASRVACIMPNLACEFGTSHTFVCIDDMDRDDEPPPLMRRSRHRGGGGGGDDWLALVNILERLGTYTTCRARELPAATALTGSGPNFMQLILQCLAESAEIQGLDADRSVRATIDLLKSTHVLLDRDPAALAAIATRGGTTQAGRQAMLDAGLAMALRRGMDMAANRAREIQDELLAGPPRRRIVMGHGGDSVTVMSSALVIAAAASSSSSALTTTCDLTGEKSRHDNNHDLTLSIGSVISDPTYPAFLDVFNPS